MKYSSVKNVNSKTLRISALDGGLVSGEAATALPDNALQECCNMWLSDGRLKTRPGLSTNFIYAYKPNIYEDEAYSYYATGTFVTVNGEKKQVILGKTHIADAYYYIYIFFAGANGNLQPAGEMLFRRTGSDIYYMPYNMVFYEGKPQNGGGIFMLLAVRDKYHPEDRYSVIYEINTELSDWEEVTDFYVPTLYINGRGNKYSLAKSENTISVDSPKTLESPNMLNGRFHAYYTSDGYSYSFRLPFTNLAEEIIVCKIYYTLCDYIEWTIGANTIIDTQLFFGANVSMIADRDKGTVYFKNSGGDYAIPIMDMYHENNIKITATKKIENGFEKIVTSSCTATGESRIFFAGGAYGNEVYSASYQNPLYFPLESTVTVGEDNKPITGLAVKENKILAFKESETHLLTFSKGSAYNSTSLLADNDSIFRRNDSFTSVCISNRVGCSDFKTFAFCGKNAVWLGNDGIVYAMQSLTDKTIYEISSNIQKALNTQLNSGLSITFAVYGNGYYMLNIGKKCFIMKCGKNGIASYSNTKNMKWFLWEFPKDITLCDGFVINSKCHFIVLGSKQQICYIATLSGESDTNIYYLDGEVVSEEININSSLVTKSFNFGKPAVKKNVEAVYITLASKGKVSIGLNGNAYTDIDFGFSNEDYNKGIYKSVKLLRNLHAVENVFISISSSADLSVGELEISYTY